MPKKMKVKIKNK